MLEVLPTSENQTPARQMVTAVQLLLPIARLWCRSFGVNDEKSVNRLTAMLADKVREELAAGVRMGRIQSHFDEAAAAIIRDWFSWLMGREIPADGKSLAILRLAFLDANYDGRWSPVFLSRDICVQELSSELDTMMIEPTPVAAPRPMLRQVF